MRIIKTIVLVLAVCLTSLNVAGQIQKPAAVVQTGHAREIKYAVFSPDRKTIASVAADVFAGAEVKIWNARTGKLVYTFPCIFYRGDPLVYYSRSGKYLATYDKWGGKFDVWDLDKGVKLAEEILPEPDNEIWKNLLKDDEFNPALPQISKKEYDKLQRLTESEAVSADLKERLQFENDRITVFDSKSRKKISEFGQSNKIVGKAVISPDGESFAFTVGVAETTNGFEGVYPIKRADKARIIVWAVSSTPKLFDGEFDFLSTPVFSSDGKLLAATAAKEIEFVNADGEKEEKTKYTVVLWNTESGNIIRRVENESFYDFNDAGSHYLTRTESETDAAEAETETAAKDVKVKIYNAQTGNITKTFATTKVELTADKKTVVVWNDALDFEFFSTATGLSLGSRQIPAEPTSGRWEYKLFDPSGSRIFLIKQFDQESIKLFDFDLQKFVADIPLEVNREVFERPVETVYSPDGTRLATLNFGGNRGYSGSLYNLQTGKSSEILYTAALPAFNRTGNLLAVGSMHGSLAIYDAKTGAAISNIKTGAGGIGAVAFHPDNFVVTSINGDNSIRIYSPDGKLLATLVVNDESSWLVTTPEGYFDGTSEGWERIGWRFQSNPFDITPIEPYFNDFFYPNLLQDVLAGNSPQLKAGQEIEKIDRRQPNVRIAHVSDSSKPQISGQMQAKTARTKRTTTVLIEVSDNNGKKKQPNHPDTSGATDLRLFRNGSLVKVWRGDVFDTAKSGCRSVAVKPGEPPRVRCKAEISIIAGANNLTAYAFNRANVKSNDATAAIAGKFPKNEGTLYVLAIGVNKYANSKYNLNFAVPDVVDIGSAIRHEQSRLASDAKIRQYAETEIITLKDETATRDNILLALGQFTKDAATGGAARLLPENLCAKLPENLCAELKIELAKIKPAMPEDALIVYFAGHGVSRGERFYLLPHNFTGTDAEKSFGEQGVSDVELNDYLEKVDAGRLLMAIDACQSGAALGAKDAGRAPMNSKGLAQLAYDKGMYILTAAQTQESALEAVSINGKEIKHGLLTYSLLEGLKNPAADRDGNKQLWEREWLDYATEQVPLLQSQWIKQRDTDIINLDDGKTKPDNRALQTPRVFYKRETSANPFIITKP